MALANDPVDTNLMQPVIGVADVSSQVTNHGNVADPAQGLNAVQLEFNGGYAILGSAADSLGLGANTYEFEFWARSLTAGVSVFVYATDNVSSSGDGTLNIALTGEWQNYRWTSKYPASSSMNTTLILVPSIPCTLELYRYSTYKKRIYIPPSTVWVPPSNPQAHWAAHASGHSNGQMLNQLENQNGAVYSAPVIGTAQSFESGTFNSKGSLNLSGSGGYNFGLNLSGSNKPATWALFAVVSFNNLSDSFLFGSGPSSASQFSIWGLLEVGRNALGSLSTQFGDQSGYWIAETAGGVVSGNTPYLLELHWNGTAMTYVINGVSATFAPSVSSAPIPAGPAYNFILGQAGDFTPARAQIKLAEFLGYVGPTAISSGNISEIREHLRTFYALY